MYAAGNVSLWKQALHYWRPLAEHPPHFSDLMTFWRVEPQFKLILSLLFPLSSS